MPNIMTFETLDDEIKKVGGKPTVLEALWDGDTEGWFLCLYIYTETGFFFNRKTKRHLLGNITLGNDIRIFSGGQWAEAFLAKKFGEKAIEKYNLEFYFPSDKEPDSDCPKWSDRHSAIKCKDCKKLIIPTDSPYLPKNICYNCHLNREQKKRIVNEEPCDDGVPMYLSKNDMDERIGYCTYFESFTIAPFINDKVQKQRSKNVINVVTLDKSDIVELNGKLENALELKLKGYLKPVIDERMKRFAKIHKVEYKGTEYELAARFNNDHDEISNLFASLQTNQKAIDESFIYKIYFKKGITYRDDSVMRFVNYVCKGKTEIERIKEHYKGTLNENQVLRTIKKLRQIDCLKVIDNVVTITKTGKNIV